MIESEDFSTTNGMYGNFYPPPGKENFFHFFPNAKNAEIGIDTLTIFPRDQVGQKQPEMERTAIPVPQQTMPPRPEQTMTVQAEQTQQSAQPVKKEAVAA